MAGWRKTDLRRLGELIRRIETENPHSLFYQVADSSSGWLPASSPQLKVPGPVVVSLSVAMMHLLLWQKRPPQHRSHDLRMLGDVPSFVGVGMFRFPDVDIPVAGFVPALS
jgi:hypothetical protein